MTVIKPVSVISDLPESNTPSFGFEAYARTITGMILHSANKTPMVIGIYGAWGSGKTTLMQNVKTLLEQPPQPAAGTARRCKTIWFQAWKYAKEEEILAALIEEIFKAMKYDNYFSECKAEVEKLVKRVSVPNLVEKLSNLLGVGDVAQIFGELEYKQKLGFYDTFQDFFDRLIWDYLNWRFKWSGNERTDDAKACLVIFIDDLDRCPKDRILNVLETIKLFLDKPACVFVIGAAHDIILNALKKTYEADAVRFMDKIVQISFNLPQIPVNDFERYVVEKIPESMRNEVLPHLPLVIPAVQNNPRQLKRFLNNLNLMEGIRQHQEAASGIQFEHLLYWSIIEYVSPSLRKEILDDPDILETLKNHIAALIADTETKMIQDIREEHISAEKIPQSYHPYLRHKGLRNIIRQFNATNEQIRQLISLSSIVKSAEEMAITAKAKIVVNAQGMVRVSAGEFRYGETLEREKIETPFMIDIYPVTNEQFQQFIEDGGYEDKSLWSDEGWKWRSENNIVQPLYWQDENWNSPNQPVVGVSYFEAQAFARRLGKRLPTEKEWERAARGIDGNKYPWGDEFDADKCNTKESGLNKTSLVIRYSKGISPVGCYDMAGNVWEWTGTQENGLIILRGGCWASPKEKAACTSKDTTGSPTFRKTTVGFRCAAVQP